MVGSRTWRVRRLWIGRNEVKVRTGGAAGMSNSKLDTHQIHLRSWKLKLVKNLHLSLCSCSWSMRQESKGWMSLHSSVWWKVELAWTWSMKDLTLWKELERQMRQRLELRWKVERLALLWNLICGNFWREEFPTFYGWRWSWKSEDWYSLVREIRANESFVYSLQEFWTNHKISLGNRRSMLVERMERSLTKARWVLLRQLREPVVFAPESLLRSPWLLSLVYSLKESSLELLGWETTFNRCSKVKVFFVPTSVPSFLSCSLHSRPLFLEFGKELGSTCDREAWWKKGKRWQWIHSLGRDLSQTERIVERLRRSENFRGKREL